MPLTDEPTTSQQVAWKPICSLNPYAGNARTHSPRQIKQIAASIRRFGFVNPVLINGEGSIVAGHGRVEAAKSLEMDEVPTLALSHPSDVELRAYVLADNKLAENAGWDRDLLAIELQALVDLDFDVELTGFGIAEIDIILDEGRGADQTPVSDEAANRLPEAKPGTATTEPGDLWIMGPHRLICADARSPEAIDRLIGADKVDLIFTDPPYNVAINGHVSGLGKARHREFAFASGEMSQNEFTTFLTESLSVGAARCENGAIAFVCMDWRHMREMLAAGEAVFSELKNLCVWNKTNGGMGSFYRSKHELVFVWKVGQGAHTNSFGLGDTGRYRTNVWDYAGANSFGAGRDDDLAMHPTVKPVELIADALRDCSRRNEVVLDMFAGSGSTLIAAERTGRRACLVDYDPGYCDTILRRYQELTGKPAVHEASDREFDAHLATEEREVAQ